VDYLHERQAAMDYVSLRQLSTKLVLLFWRSTVCTCPIR
jgi:hypothetical protein